MLEAWEEEERGATRDPFDGQSEGTPVGSRHVPVRPLFELEVVAKPRFSSSSSGTSSAPLPGFLCAAAVSGDSCVLASDNGNLSLQRFSSSSPPLLLELCPEEKHLQNAPSSSSASGGKREHAVRVFVDTTGSHCLALSDRGALFYLHWRGKARAMPKLKGAGITAIGWHPEGTTTNTGGVILGTVEGKLLVIELDEKERREGKAPKALHSTAEEGAEPICDLRQVRGQVGGALVIIATATRLYVCTGEKEGDSSLVMAQCIELPGSLGRSQLCIHRSGSAEGGGNIGWLTDPGIYHATLQACPPPNGSHLTDRRLLQYSEIREGMTAPLSMTVTEFHILLLYSHEVLVINRFSSEAVQSLKLDPVRVGSPFELIADEVEGVPYLSSRVALFIIEAYQEGRDMWKVHLDKGEFANALEYASNDQQNIVLHEQAVAAFQGGDYERAAIIWGRLCSSSERSSFEETALKFVGAGVPDALCTFLLTSLENLRREERSQATMLTTWIAELFLDKLNRAQLRQDTDDEGDDEDALQYDAVVEDFRDFLKARCEMLDERTIISLLRSNARPEELIYYAELRGAAAEVLDYHLDARDAGKVLAVLRKPSVSPEMHYRCAPVLMEIAPGDAVDAWIALGAKLSPRLLTPALMKYGADPRGAYLRGRQSGKGPGVNEKDANDNNRDGADTAARKEAIRYLEYCVNHLAVSDRAVHNLLVALYVQKEDEAQLLSYLNRFAGIGPGQAMYDVRYALRLCLARGKRKSPVFILCSLGLFEEAVESALSDGDFALAKSVADKPEDDDALRRKLWLRVARQAILGDSEGGNNIKVAIAFLEETDGLLKIEDILPFFPDFAVIDDFKDAICEALEEYNGEIRSLQIEMDETTSGAESIRKDINSLADRHLVLESTSKCASCSLPVLGPPPAWVSTKHGVGLGSKVDGEAFYGFPCGMIFHSECLAMELYKLASHGQQKKLNELQGDVRDAYAAQQATPVDVPLNEFFGVEASKEHSLEASRANLNAFLCMECPFCSDRMIRSVTTAFITDADSEEVCDFAL